VEVVLLRGWPTLLAILLVASLSFAAGSPLQEEKQWNEARGYLAEGRFAEAQAAFEALLVTYPREPDLHYGLALASLRLRDPQAAKSALKEALAIDPGHVPGMTLLGWVELEIHGNADAAIANFSKVIELRPDSADAYLNLGAAYKKKGELDKALETYNRALGQRPDFVPALSNRGWVYAEQKRWAEARDDFEKALQLSPGDNGALQGLAEVLEKTRDYAGAQSALSQLMSQSPNFVHWLQWGRVGLIRFYWVFLLIALLLYVQSRVRKGRKLSHGE
jgi:tetratricopeptide (TPR) repeat protein